MPETRPIMHSTMSIRARVIHRPIILNRLRQSTWGISATGLRPAALCRSELRALPSCYNIAGSHTADRLIDIRAANAHQRTMQSNKPIRVLVVGPLNEGWSLLHSGLCPPHLQSRDPTSPVAAGAFFRVHTNPALFVSDRII